MTILYQVRTGTTLPKSKMFFSSLARAKEHVFKIVDLARKKGKKLKDLDLERDIGITKINTEVFPDYAKYFKGKRA
jgi:hypothetical protein